MARLCRSGKLILFLPYNDHPPPHFHVQRAGESGRVGLEPVAILDGDLSPATRRRVLRWAIRWRPEILANWYLVRAGRAEAELITIPPPE